MAYRITVWIVDPGDKKIHVEHVFYGKDEAEARRMKAHHLDACSYFRQAETAGYTDEESEEIHQSEWPVADESDGDADVIDIPPGN